jgi:hypothetical protein
MGWLAPRVVAVVLQPPAYHPGQPAPSILQPYRVVGLISAPFKSDTIRLVADWSGKKNRLTNTTFIRRDTQP